MTSSAFLADIRARAARQTKRIVYPETADPRVVEAVREVLALRIATPVLLLDPAAPVSHEQLRAFEREGAEIIDVATDRRADDAMALLLERRSARGLMEPEARRLSRHPLYFADALVHRGEADGCVAGCVYTTADVMRAALWLIGPATGVKTVSSAFYMVTRPFRGPSPEVMTFTDCAVNPYPAAAQLADIALAAAADRRRIVGDAPRVAFLSFSTRGSGTGPSVEAVREALALVRQRDPSLAVDGELQGDAALISAVAARKAAGSAVAGSANVLVFPSLDAGNIAYKLVQWVGGASAVGPIVQGLARPCSDLSRGAVPDDIVNVTAITVLQASDAGPGAGDSYLGDRV